MEENEGKNLAQDMKKEKETEEKYYEDVKLELSKINLDVMLEEINRTEKEGGQEVVEYGIYITYKGEDIKMATISSDGTLIPNRDILQDERYQSEEDQKQLGNMLNLLGLEQDKVDMNKLQETLKTLEAKSKEQIEQERNDKEKEETAKDENGEEKGDEEQGDEEHGDEEDNDPEKETLARKFNVSKKDIVHLNTGSKKVTEQQSLSDLVKWAEGKHDVYLIANRKGMIQSVVEKKGTEYKEVEQNMQQTHGNNPNVNIHLVGDDKISDVVPLQVYQIDPKQALATVRNNFGELETIYCRKEEGKGNEYWGEKVPEEKSGKNNRPASQDVRSFMDRKNTSGMDLDKKHDALEKARNYEQRGVPTKQDGVQLEEIIGNSKQNRAVVLEDIKRALMKRDGIVDELTVPPGYYDRKAEKVLGKLDGNKDLNYENAVEDVEKEEKGNRDEEGRTPGENRRRGH